MSQVTVPAKPAGRYTNPTTGLEYLIRKDQSMFQYDYFIMKGVTFGHIGRKDKRTVKGQHGLTKKEMISYCAKSSDECRNSLETNIMSYIFEKVPEAQHIEGLKLFMLCQFHAMQTNLQVVTQDGFNVTSLELLDSDVASLLRKKALPYKGGETD